MSPISNEIQDTIFYIVLMRLLVCSLSKFFVVFVVLFLFTYVCEYPQFVLDFYLMHAFWKIFFLLGMWVVSSVEVRVSYNCKSSWTNLWRLYWYIRMQCFRFKKYVDKNRKSNAKNIESVRKYREKVKFDPQSKIRVTKLTNRSKRRFYSNTSCINNPKLALQRYRRIGRKLILKYVDCFP